MMKLLLENWREFLKEEKRTINTKEELIDFIKREPNQEVYLDNPRGTTKKFGGIEPKKLPFDYGEYTELINPADNMGWDFILAPNSDKEDENLLPVGHISYIEEQELWDENDREMPGNVGNNHKIVLAQDGDISGDEKELITDFFDGMWQFKNPEWYSSER
jgi:hypothetical protein